ncbi:RidA family protein [Polluticaenibacter yanchengensis]|uniref:RidA family protein n=1 Tax=Polluticaenibacter yanchengensis TaxID=3014562 RepID=A0ABT4UK13_9BACT|nr:RidA family protein [Chitinophagaceae bacterium LY-5]
MQLTTIKTNLAPAPIGPYSQAVVANGILYVSGQIPLDPADGSFKNDNIEAETIQVMKNLKAILEDAGTTFDKAIKTTIFLTDMALFAQVNEIYGSYFSTHFPARETVAVKGLPKGANVEISMIVAI